MSERAVAGVGVVISVLSILVSVVVAIVTDVSVQVSILLGLVTALLTLGFTGFVLLREGLLQLDRRRLGALPLQQLLALPEVEPEIVRLVAQTAEVKEDHSPFMLDVAVKTIEEAASKVGDVADGRIAFKLSDEYALVQRALALTHRRVRAIAARGTAWWDTPDADEYWRLYEQAAKRLDITRVFLVSEHEDDEQLERVLERHRKAGMKTYRLSRDYVTPERCKPTVIFDEDLVHLSAPVRTGDGNQHITFSDRKADVNEAETSFKLILERAREEAGEVAIEGRANGLVRRGLAGSLTRLATVLARSPGTRAR